MNSKEISQLQNLLDEMSSCGFASGGSLSVWQDGKELCYLESGYRDLAEKIPFTRDTICRMYSMSKPVTAVGVLKLAEEGKIDLMSSLSDFIPSFANQVYLRNGEKVPVTRALNIKHLLNMTGGISYPGNEDEAACRQGALTDRLLQRLGTENEMTTREFISEMGSIPLAFNPGDGWRYSYSADILGAVCEVVTGKNFGEYLKEAIFEPLGMKDTGFWVPADRQDRLARTYMITENGLEEYTGNNLGISSRMEKAPGFESGGAGLASTIDDYMRFARMLTNKGTLDGIRILKPETVEYMRSNVQTPAQKEDMYSWENLHGCSYGNLVRVCENPGENYTLSVKGEFGWDGWLGTYLAACPEKNLSIVMMMQRTDTGTTVFTRRIRNVIFSSLK